MEFDIAIIGAGTGGYVAAIRAAQQGKKVVIVEKQDLGGVCLNKGCIPTKTLLKSAEKWQDLQHCDEFGLFISEMAYDWEKIMERKNSVIYQLRSGIEKLLKANKVTVLVGTAQIVDEHRLHLVTDNPDDERDVTMENLIIASGSEPARPPIKGADKVGVITSDDILRLSEVPASLVIIGAGAVGIEFASIYAGFGCQTTVVEMAPSILPPSDVDMQRRMALVLRKQYIECKTGAAVREIRYGAEGLEVVAEIKGKEEVFVGEKVLLAAGRRPVYDAAALDKLGVKHERRGIVVDAQMRTSVPNIYAVGDVNGMSMLAHSAAHQGMVAADAICGGSSEMDYTAIPSCVFTTPEIAEVGLTEQQCKEQGLDYVVSKFNFAANGKAVSMGQTDGLVKYIADKNTHKILGCHIMGPHASDMIIGAVEAVQLGLTAEQLETCVHPHPTLCEAMAEADLGLFNRMIHQYSK